MQAHVLMIEIQIFDFLHQATARLWVVSGLENRSFDVLNIAQLIGALYNKEIKGNRLLGGVYFTIGQRFDGRDLRHCQTAADIAA